MTTNRSEKSFLDGPIQTLQSDAERDWIHAKFVGPLRHCHGFSVVRKKSVASLIVGLFFICSPSTIIRRVAERIILAFNRMLVRWRFAHVGKKIFKFHPTPTDRYAPTAVSGIITDVRIRASLNHKSPYSIDARFPHTVRPHSLAGFLTDRATATLRVASSEIITENNYRLSTIAETNPARPRTALRKTQGGQPSEFSPSQVFKSAAAFCKIGFSHIASFLGFVIRAVSGVASIGGSSFIAHRLEISYAMVG